MRARSALFILLLSLALASSSCQGTHVTQWALKLNPHGTTPMACQARLVTAEPVQLLAVHLQPGVSSEIPNSPYSTEHELPIIGFKAGTRAEVRLSFRRQGGPTETTGPLTVEIDPLPDFIPELEVSKTSSQTEGGYLLLGLVPLDSGPPLAQKGMILLLDLTGEVLWYHKLERSPTEIRRTSRGTLLFQTLDGLDSIEMNWLGETLQHLQSTGLRKAEQDQTAVNLETLHHDFSETQAGQWTLSSKKVGEFIDETVVLLNNRGEVLKELSLMTLLDPKRELYPKFPNFWEMFYGPGVIDWGHSNSLVVDPSEKTALVSLRHQDAVVKVDLNKDKIMWILGRPDLWGPQHQELLLQPQGDVRWFAKQHAAKWMASGHVLLFDNGRQQSRAVEFAIDERAGTVEQVWQFTGDEPFFSEYLCDVDELPKTGHIQITDGARKTNSGEFFARILEVTHTSPSQVLWELTLRRPKTKGCTVYRSQRLPTLY